MYGDIYAQAVLAAAVATVIFAFWKGDEPERLGAAAYAIAYIATTMIRGDATPNVPRWGMRGVEIVLMGVFIGLAWQSRRAWPVWAASFQALIVTNYVLVAASLRPPLVAAAAVINMSNYGLLIGLAVGTFWAWQERKAARLGERPGPHL